MNVFSHFLLSKDKSLGDCVPLGFNVMIDLLSPGRAEIIRQAILEGQLDGYVSDGKWWIKRGELEDLLGPGHSTYDEADGCCYIPSPEAT